jgi:uncharacterized membrane protein YfcA
MESTLLAFGNDRDRSASSAVEIAIGAAARKLDAQPLRQRARLERSTLRKLFLLGGGFVALIALSVGLAGASQDAGEAAQFMAALVPVVILMSFLFETLDSAAGMGFGTALSPLLLALGYDPLAVVPVLLLSEAATGLVTAAIHHELSNVRFSFRGSMNEASRLSLIIAGTGVISICASVTLTYLALDAPKSLIKGFVAGMVILMALAALARHFSKRQTRYRPRRMIAFAAWAAFNKGIGGGGYGPVLTLGQLYSGVYEKSAAAITSLAEGATSIAGVAAFFALNAVGVELDFGLLPSVLAGSVLAAILAPYLVRIMPNRALGYLIPIYALLLGFIAFIE